MPEIKQGKIIAGDPAELDVLTLKHRREGWFIIFCFLSLSSKSEKAHLKKK